MQELLPGSLGVQLFGFVSRYPLQVFAGVLVATLLIVQLMRNNRGSSTGGDIELGGAGLGCDGDGGGRWRRRRRLTPLPSRAGRTFATVIPPSWRGPPGRVSVWRLSSALP
jgi:hypothetical protein